MSIAYGMMAYLLLLPLASFAFLKYNHKDLHKPEMKAKWENLYAEVHVMRESFEVYYYPLFLVRRLYMIMLPAIFAFYPFF